MPIHALFFLRCWPWGFTKQCQTHAHTCTSAVIWHICTAQYCHMQTWPHTLPHSHHPVCHAVKHNVTPWLWCRPLFVSTSPHQSCPLTATPFIPDPVVFWSVTLLRVEWAQGWGERVKCLKSLSHNKQMSVRLAFLHPFGIRFCVAISI